jgi:hypothetical protein
MMFGVKITRDDTQKNLETEVFNRLSDIRGDEIDSKKTGLNLKVYTVDDAIKELIEMGESLNIIDE